MVSQREIFIGQVSECPVKWPIGKFAYHIRPLDDLEREEQTDRDFSYLLKDKYSLVEQLNSLQKRYNGIEILLVNGIPKDLTGSRAPEYRFSGLTSIDFEEIKKLSGLEGQFI